MAGQSWADRITGYRAADKQAREQAEQEPPEATVTVPFHLVSLLETIAAQQAEQTLLLQEILAALRAQAG
jgi:hypothetical protein